MLTQFRLFLSFHFLPDTHTYIVACWSVCVCVHSVCSWEELCKCVCKCLPECVCVRVLSVRESVLSECVGEYICDLSVCVCACFRCPAVFSNNVKKRFLNSFSPCFAHTMWKTLFSVLACFYTSFLLLVADNFLPPPLPSCLFPSFLPSFFNFSPFLLPYCFFSFTASLCASFLPLTSPCVSLLF